MADKVSFKVCLEAKRGRRRDRKHYKQKEDVQRFVLDKDNVSLATLQLKISQLNPDFSQNEDFLSWIDEENDCVTISNDEDLDIALKELPGPVYNIFINKKEVVNCVQIEDKVMKKSKSKKHAHKILLPARHHGKVKNMDQYKRKGRGPKKEREKSVNYKIYSHENSPLSLLEGILLGGGHRGTRHRQGRRMNIEIKIKVKMVSPTHKRRARSSSSSSSSISSSTSSSSSRSSSSSSTSSSSSSSSSSTSSSSSNSSSNSLTRPKSKHHSTTRREKKSYRNQAKKRKDKSKSKKEAAKKSLNTDEKKREKPDNKENKKDMKADNDWTVVTDKKNEDEKRVNTEA